jgi:membrane protein YqaA with SNARE-associated domain
LGGDVVKDINMEQSERNISKVKLSTRILSVFFVLVIIAISVCIFVFREKIQHLGNIGYLGVLFLCFVCNATILAPAPSLAVIISSALTYNPIFVALVGATGTTLGEAVGYYSGYLGKNIVDFKNNKIASLVKKYGAPIIFVFALMPLPLFDIIGIASGYLRIKFYKFYIACFVGKFVKMAIYAVGANHFVKYISF